MKIKRVFLLLLCVIGLYSFAKAQQNINFTSLTTKNGLSSNFVNVMLKDHVGLMWFGTEDGLNRFDGTKFTVYRHIANDSASLQANEILSLHEDKLGNLWVGTGGGSLSMYNRQKDAFINFPATGKTNAVRNNVIRAIQSDDKGKVWIAHYAGIDIIDPTNKTLSAFRLNSKTDFTKAPTYLFEDSKTQHVDRHK